MKVWYDACTGKHIRYGAAIAKRFRSGKYNFIFTTREHPDTLPLARILGETPIVVGRYDPTTLNSRLQEGAKRTIKFLKIFEDNRPDIAIAHQSVELCSTAFGLDIPIILTADTPYAYAVNRLTIPFAHTVVVSEALPRTFTRNNCAKKVVTFRGVDEVAWIKDFKPTKIAGLKKPLIVVRQIESKATYAQEKQDLASTFIKKLATLGNVKFIQRYNQNDMTFGVKEGLEDSANLVANADLVVCYGGTIGREAALQGIPTIGLSDMAKTNVNRYLAEKGFPFFNTNETGVFDLAKKYIGKKFDVTGKLAELENPVDIIENIMEKIIT
jgi:predicted glycosyltransferase